MTEKRGRLMNPENGRPAAEYGLAGNGSSRQWDVAVEESLDGGAWTLEIEGPQTYFVFQLREAQALSDVTRFLLEPATPDRTGPPYTARGELMIGRFGSAPVSFVWDDEEAARCFLVVGPQGVCSLRLSLDGEDVRMLGGGVPPSPGIHAASSYAVTGRVATSAKIVASAQTWAAHDAAMPPERSRSSPSATP